MKCEVCKKSGNKASQVSPLLVVHGVQIYKCEICGLGFVAKNTPRLSTHSIYSFTDYDSRREQFEKRYKKIVTKINKIFDGKTSRNRIRILEIGAGFGLLSKMLSDEEYNVTALDPLLFPTYTKTTKVKFIKTSLREYAKTKTQKYNCIILFDVLEHVDNLESTLYEMRRLLMHDGIIVIQTPNYASLMRCMSKDWSWWMVEDHRYFFTKNSLLKLLNHAKFSLLYYSSYEDWEDFSKNLDGWVTGITNEVFRKSLKLGIYICAFILRFILSPVRPLGIGGLHVVFAQKLNKSHPWRNGIQRRIIA